MPHDRVLLGTPNRFDRGLLGTANRFDRGLLGTPNRFDRGLLGTANRLLFGNFEFANLSINWIVNVNQIIQNYYQFWPDAA